MFMHGKLITITLNGCTSYIIEHDTVYSRKIWRGIKFGGLVICITTAKLKSAKISYSHIRIRMAIPYRTAKFKSANISGYTMEWACRAVQGFLY